MATLQSLNINDTGNLTLPSGTSANRPTTNYTVVRWLTSGATVLTGSATTTATSWTCPTGVTNIEVLAVGGGGGGGGWGGGGGAGGLVYNNAYPVTPGTVYNISIGAGGAKGTSAYTVGGNGGNTVFGTIRAIGGGGGGAWPSYPGVSGGSGGGGSGTSTFGLGTPGQGQNGGPSPNTTTSSPYQGHGGGGGAGWPGSQGSGVTGGAGGNGLAYSISGSSVTYAGGGGGHSPGDGNAAVAPGGTGGGGQGGNYYNPASATDGTNGLGGGGGGNWGGDAARAIGAGGSGVVIIRYALTSSTTTPVAQLRFNSTYKSTELYTANNYWNTANGLVLHLDAGNGSSYSGSGSTWTDLSGYGNNCVFDVLPTYASTAPGYFTFNGTSHYGTIIHNPTLDFSSGQTLIMYLRHSYTSGRRNPWDQAYGGYGTWTHEQGENMSQYYGTAGSNTNPYYGMSSATTARNVWNMMCATRDANGFKWYVNGVLSFAGRYNDFGVLPDTRTNIRLGNGYAGYWQGDMSMVMAFTRALTSEEIQQIYQDYKTRYGN